jgi:pimeloyl-ACP methyl ester carboxylesterase
VVDFAAARSEIDAAKIALIGVSFGGYLAPRAATGEPRIAACIADPGEFSLLGELKSRMPSFVAHQLPAGNHFVLSLLNLMLRSRMRHATAGWPLRRGLWVHGVTSPLAYLHLMQDYSLDGRVDRIRCLTLICRAENDEIGVTARRLYDALSCEKAFIEFAAHDGAGEHCEAGARSVFCERAFDWLDTVLAR